MSQSDSIQSHQPTPIPSPRRCVVELPRADKRIGINTGSVTPSDSPGLNGREEGSIGTQPMESVIETLLEFDYRLGHIPFRLSLKTNGFYDCVVKAMFGFMSVCSLAHIIIKIRMFAVLLDDAGSKKGNTFWFMAIGYQLSVMLLQFRYAYLHLCKQTRFAKLVALLRTTGLRQDWHFNRIGLISIVTRFSTLLICTVTVLGGFSLNAKKEKWSFHQVLEEHETDIVLAIEPLVPSAFYNTSGNDGGVFLRHPNAETYLLGGIGLALEFMHQTMNSSAYDFLLLSTITLWLYMKWVKRELKIAKNSKYSYTRDQYEKLAGMHKELEEMSHQINHILNLFLPALTLTSIILASYFTHICFHREWRLAVPYAFKLGKIVLTYMLAIEISDYEDSFNNWYISEEAPTRLVLDLMSFHLKLKAMSQRQVGIGKGIFYIDTRFICSYAGITSSYFFIVTESLAERGCN